MVSEFMWAESFDFRHHEKVRSDFTWGSFGKKGDGDLSTSLLKNLSTNHIYNILRTQHLNKGVHDMFVMELCYRTGDNDD